MMMVDTGGGGGDKVQQSAGNHGHGQGAVSYAGLVAGKQPNGRKKLNILDIMLERRDNTVNFKLKRDELANLRSIQQDMGKSTRSLKTMFKLRVWSTSLHLILGIISG